MCRVNGCRRGPQDGSLGSAFNGLCNAHHARDRRHGDPLQQPIRACHLAPYIRSLKHRQAIRPDAPAWAALEARWMALVQSCKDTRAVYDSGQPMNRWQVEAAGELVKVAGEASPDDAWRTAVGMFLLREADPRMFPTDRAFNTQLGRRVRHLGTTSRAMHWDSGEGRFKGVYRDPSPRAAAVVGDMLAETFGVAGVYFARQATAEADAKAAERTAFHAALNEVAPGIAGAAGAAGVA